MNRDSNSHGGRARTAARTCLYGIVALAPLVMTRLFTGPPLTHDAFELPKAIVVRTLTALALLLWTIAVNRERRSVRLSWWLAPVAAYVGWVALATAFSRAPIVSILGGHARLDGLTSVATYGVLAFVGLQLFTSGAHLLALARTITASALVVSAYGALQTQGFHPFYQLGTAEFTSERAFASLGNPVFLGGYLVLVLPVMTVIAMADESRGWRIAAWAGVIAGTVALIGTATRAAWLVAVVEIGLFAVALVRKRVRVRPSGIAALVAGAIAGVAVIVRSMRSGDQVMNVVLRFSSMFRGDDGSSTERFLVMKAATQAVLERPLVGFGPARFTEAFNRFRPAAHVAAYPHGGIDNAHNMVLQVAATAGLPAAAAWLTATVWPLVTTARAAFSAESGRQRLVLTGLWIGGAGYAVFLMAGISVMGASPVFWIILAALAGMGARTVELRGRWVSALPLVAAVALVVVVGWSSARFAADNRYMLARERVHGLVPGDPEQATIEALRFAPWDMTYRQHLVLLAQGTDPVEAKRTALLVLEVEPDDLLTNVLLVQTHLELGELEQAVRVLQHAKEIAPTNPDVIALERKVSSQTPLEP